MRNKRGRALLIVLIICFTINQFTLPVIGITDIDNHWAKTQIEKWIESGFITGYTDGSFRPDNKISRAEFVVLINRAFNINKQNNIVEFTDIKKSDWYFQDIITAMNDGYISGYPDGSFKPNNYISRQEVAVVLERLLHIETNNHSIENFTDRLDFPKWSKDSIDAVTYNKIMKGYPDGSFRPENFITRAEAVVALDKALSLYIEQNKSNIDTEKEIKDKKDNGDNHKTDNNTENDESEKDEDNKNITVTFDIPEYFFIYDKFDGYITDTKITELTGSILYNNCEIEKVEVKIKSGKLDLKQNEVIVEDDKWLLKEPQMITGDNEITIIAYGTDNVVDKYTCHVWNSSYENMNLLNMDMGDNDNDDLLNYEEAQYGTDPNKVDTDDDGFADIYEIFLLQTDPLAYTEDEDFDEDGLSNKEELEYNTEIYQKDTDHDGLTDYEEVKVYNTNPLSIDTDDDDVNDYEEVSYGLNPSVAEKTYDDGTIKVNYVSEYNNEDVQPDLEIYLKPKQVETLSIKKIPGTDPVLSSEIPGYLGCAYDFYVEGNFNNATLTFTFDESLWENEDFYPAIYYYNEDAHILEELDNQTIKGNSVSVKLEHFSTYILLNKTEFDSVWTYDILFDEDNNNRHNGIDIVFVIDSSGSMSSNDSKGVRKQVTKDFINKLTENDRAAVIDFDSTAKLYSTFTSDKDILYDAVDKINSSGGTNLTKGISLAIDQFIDSLYNGAGRAKYIIMLTDGKGSYNTNYTDIAKSNDIVIYTIGLGSSISESVLTLMAEGTGGNYYHASESNQLFSIFESIADLTDLYKDSDEDGLSDYYEKEMGSGRLRLGTGVPLIGLDYLNNDTDNDGLKDGEEIKIRRYQHKIYVDVYSNPIKVDTDEDGLNDYLESNEIATSIGTFNQKDSEYKISPLKWDSDDDGKSDKYELGTYYEEGGYYRVNSNPFIKEDYNIGSDEAISYVKSHSIFMPKNTKKEYETGMMLNGENYTIYKFIDMSAYPLSIRKLIEVGSDESVEYYILFARTGNNVRGGQYDEIYRKASLVQIGKKQILVTKGSLFGLFINATSGEAKVDIDPSEFLYYDYSEKSFLTPNEWKNNIHYKERYELNEYYDTFLPINSLEALNKGFKKLPQNESVYHMPEGITDETHKGASHKYITTDGLEAIYEIMYSANVEIISKDPNGTKLLPLQENPDIGPTFNYSPNDSSTNIIDKIPSTISDNSIAHYYFDMLPYYWWGNVE